MTRFVPMPLLLLVLLTPPLESAAESSLECRGEFVQGGFAICTTEPGVELRIGKAHTRADAEGNVVLGFDRDAPAEEFVDVLTRPAKRHRFRIEGREFSVSRIDGLPKEQVDTYTQEQLARIESSSRRKALGDQSRAPIAGFAKGRFQSPVDPEVGRESSPFGAQRILNGTPKRPHYGVDLAAPAGSPVVAPADALVALADDDLYFEGAMVVLDHGQGLHSKYLHLSRIDVEVGERVERGQVIGAVGSRGRSTGPHLCWRLKWRDRNLDPGLWVEP